MAGLGQYLQKNNEDQEDILISWDQQSSSMEDKTKSNIESATKTLLVEDPKIKNFDSSLSSGQQKPTQNTVKKKEAR